MRRSVLYSFKLWDEDTCLERPFDGKFVYSLLTLLILGSFTECYLLERISSITICRCLENKSRIGESLNPLQCIFDSCLLSLQRFCTARHSIVLILLRNLIQALHCVLLDTSLSSKKLSIKRLNIVFSYYAAFDSRFQKVQNRVSSKLK